MAQPFNGDPGTNPSVAMELEAVFVDLHGDLPAVGEELDDPNRLSREAADTLAVGVRATLEPHVRPVEHHWPDGTPYTVNEVVLPPEVAERYRLGLLAGVMGMAEGVLVGSDVAALKVVANTLISDHYDETRIEGYHDDGSPSHYSFHLEYGSLRDLASVARDVAECVARFEGNEPFGTYSSGLANDVRRVRETRLRSVHESLRQNPALIGVETAEDVVRIFNAIVRRLNDHYPSFMGSRETLGYPLPSYNIFEKEYEAAELERMRQAEYLESLES